uniref:S-locus receptor kinase C-terminal domain-containing protein n=1 Tax=Salix viminalis TaxID=40686 RepID=A0A6N2N9P4_SALVM
MSAVVVILGSDMPLPQPKQPGFFMGENPHEQRTSSNKHVTYSGDEVSLMSLEARHSLRQVLDPVATPVKYAKKCSTECELVFDPEIEKTARANRKLKTRDILRP